MKNIKQLLNDWQNDDIQLNAIKFANASELAAFIHYAFNALGDSEFCILMEDLQTI